jgi:hypothetical protein
MGTRADFYIGTGKDAEWIGSIAFDGYRIHEMTKEHSFKNLDSMECWAIKTATDEKVFRQAVTKLLALNDDATTPDQGWPWPWGDSKTTDRAYCFADGKCKVFAWGAEVTFRPDGDYESAPKAEWPDMRNVQNVTLGHRSGTLIVRGP